MFGKKTRAAAFAALIVWIFVREEPIDLEIAPAV